MGSLVQQEEGRSVLLREHHVIGRAAERVDLYLCDPNVSRQHASIEWTGDGWVIRDHSRNGCWLNGSRIPRLAPQALALEDVIQLGSSQSPVWRLVNDAPPRDTLVSLTAGVDDIELEDFHFVPNEENPVYLLHYSPERASWLASGPLANSQAAIERELKHGDELHGEGCCWRFLAVGVEKPTAISPACARSAEQFEFVFELSSDEEHTRLVLRDGDTGIDLGQRSHHYLLMHLARLRAEEATLGYDSTSQGWVDTDVLTRQLGLDLSHINILLFRARKQIASGTDTGLGADGLVERRKGQIRFGDIRFRIYQGAELKFQAGDNRAHVGAGIGTSL